MWWSWGLSNLFRFQDASVFHILVQDLITNYKTEFDTNPLFVELEKLQAPEAHWTFISLVAMILITIALFLVGALI